MIIEQRRGKKLNKYNKNKNSNKKEKERRKGKREREERGDREREEDLHSSEIRSALEIWCTPSWAGHAHVHPHEAP